MHVFWSRSGSGAGFQIFAGAGAGVELGQKFDRLRNLGYEYMKYYSSITDNINSHSLSTCDQPCKFSEKLEMIEARHQALKIYYYGLSGRK